MIAYPDYLYYTREHEWIRVEDNIAMIGITDFAQSELGDIVYVDIPSVGKALNMNDIFGSVEAVKTVSDLYLPLSGTVTEVNAALEANPELVNQAPYEGGWMVKMTLSNAEEAAGLLDAAAYQALVGA